MEKKKVFDIFDHIRIVDLDHLCDKYRIPGGSRFHLFLDDVREPEHVAGYIHPIHWRDEYRLEDWYVVRNFHQFESFLEVFAQTTSVISFDHDLAEEHYCTPEALWNDYEASKEFQSRQQYKEKTGADCARWLVQLLQERGLKPPRVMVHSQNPVGADNIRAVFDAAYPEYGGYNGLSGATHFQHIK